MSSGRDPEPAAAAETRAPARTAGVSAGIAPCSYVSSKDAVEYNPLPKRSPRYAQLHFDLSPLTDCNHGLARTDRQRNPEYLLHRYRRRPVHVVRRPDV